MKSLLLLQKIERWFLSSNAKDIGVLYLMFALISGLIGTAYLVLIHLELVEFDYIISDNQLYCLVPIVSLRKLNPWFVTGFIDGEGSFGINIIKKKVGYSVKPVFQISLHSKDQVLLESIQSFFGGVGRIYFIGKDSIKYQVRSVEGLEVIINQLDKYSLITQKQADFLLFKQVLELIKNKEHLTIEG
jgi:hypothetical protein